MSQVVVRDVSSKVMTDVAKLFFAREHDQTALDIACRVICGISPTRTPNQEHTNFSLSCILANARTFSILQSQGYNVGPIY